MPGLGSKLILAAVLLASLLVRLYRIDAPIAGWRQADTAAIARNFHQNGYMFFYPQIDWGGDTPGYVETECPLYPFAVSILYALLGDSEVWGRLLTALFALVSIYTTYLLVRQWIDESTGLWSAIFFAVLPRNTYYGRAFMPEAALLMCALLGIYFFSTWLRGEKPRHFYLSALFVAFAGLIKLPILYIGLPLLFLAWLKYQRRLLRIPALWLFALLVLLPVAAWYYHAHQTFQRFGLTFGIWQYGSDKWGNWDLVLTGAYWYKVLIRNIAENHLAWIGFPLFLWGLFLKRRTTQEMVLDVWLLAGLVYLIIVGQGNYVHEYYQLPLMIPVAAFMGKLYGRYMKRGLIEDKRSLALALSFLALTAVSLARYVSGLEREAQEVASERELVRQVREETDEKALFVFLFDGDPTLQYHCQRKGWQLGAVEVTRRELLDRIERGARYVLGSYRAMEGDSGRQELESRLPVPFQLRFDDGTHFLLRLEVE